MKALRWLAPTGLLLTLAAWMLYADKIDPKNIRTGKDAWADSVSLKPGLARKISMNDLPQPKSPTPSRDNVIARPGNAWPQAPAGFRVDLYAGDLNAPRQIRMSPSGDYFVADRDGKILVFRGITKDGKFEQTSVFAEGLRQPFGIAFYPLGANPQWVYVTNTNSLVRYPYKSGDLKAAGPAETLVSELPTGGHWTRDIVFSKDGKSLFLAVGSATNVDDPDKNKSEFHRANILEYTPDGKFVGVYASGIRNPVGLGINPETGELWCSVNERDNLGDNLVPDYVTHVERGGFYGWPYFYIGPHADSRLNGAHPELQAKTLVPDVLLQPHNASLGLTFYDGAQFPAEYRGDLFAAEHGSWNRSVRAGHEVIRVPLEKGRSSGVYQDFLTGFVTPEGKMWGRPVAVVVAKDGSMLVTDDGSRSIWRVSYAGK